jgi:hypothetical protein
MYQKECEIDNRQLVRCKTILLGKDRRMWCNASATQKFQGMQNIIKQYHWYKI